MDKVSTSKRKEARINLKISPSLRAEFHIAASLRGATMSSLLHQFIVKTVREEKEREPGAFADLTPVSQLTENLIQQKALFSNGAVTPSKESKEDSLEIKKDVDDIKRAVGHRTRSKKQRR